MAISAALDFAMDHPEDVAYPWVDETGEVLQLSSASDKGDELLQPIADLLPTPHEVRHAPRSMAALDRIAYDVTLVLGIKPSR